MAANWQILVMRQSSYKGIPFNVKSVDTKFGRKLQDQSSSKGAEGIAAILGSNTQKKKGADGAPVYLDQGLLPKKITVAVEFSGDDYNNTRDAFITAVEAGGAGKLVLPTYNIYAKALAESGTMRFSDKRGGVESCTITFVIQGESTSPGKASSGRGLIANNYKASKASGASDFASNSIVSGVESVFDLVVDYIGDFVDSVRENLKSGAVKTDETYDETIKVLDEIEAQAATLAANPVDQASAFDEVIDGITEAFTTVESAFSAVIGVASSYAGKIQTVTGAGPLAIARAKNRITGLIFIKNACLSNAALLLSQLDFGSVDDVQNIRETFETAVRDLQDDIGSTSGFAETYRDLVKLNAAVFNDLVERSAALPVIEQRTIQTDASVLNYAYSKYGDADRASEILTRNDIKRSLFASGDVELLSR